MTVLDWLFISMLIYTVCLHTLTSAHEMRSTLKSQENIAADLYRVEITQFLYCFTIPYRTNPLRIGLLSV